MNILFADAITFCKGKGWTWTKFGVLYGNLSETGVQRADQSACRQVFLPQDSTWDCIFKFLMRDWDSGLQAHHWRFGIVLFALPIRATPPTACPCSWSWIGSSYVNLCVHAKKLQDSLYYWTEHWLEAGEDVKCNILVPWCSYEIAKLGFSSQGCEFSYQVSAPTLLPLICHESKFFATFPSSTQLVILSDILTNQMLISSNFILNHASGKQSIAIHPWILSSSNVWDAAQHQFQQIMLVPEWDGWNLEMRHVMAFGENDWLDFALKAWLDLCCVCPPNFSVKLLSNSLFTMLEPLCLQDSGWNAWWSSTTRRLFNDCGWFSWSVPVEWKGMGLCGDVLLHWYGLEPPQNLMAASSSKTRSCMTLE